MNGTSDHNGGGTNGGASSLPSIPPKTRYLKVMMTRRDKRLIGDKLGKGYKKIDFLKAKLARLSERVKNVKGTIDAIHESSAALQRKKDTGYKFEDVPCEEVIGVDPRLDAAHTNAATLGMVTRRLDTNEVIEWRTFTTEEKQGKLFDAPTMSTLGASA